MPMSPEQTEVRNVVDPFQITDFAEPHVQSKQSADPVDLFADSWQWATGKKLQVCPNN